MTDDVEDEMDKAEDGDAKVEIEVDAKEAVCVGQGGGDPVLRDQHCEDAAGHKEAPGSRLLCRQEGAGDRDHGHDGDRGEDGVCVLPRHPLETKCVGEP